MFVVNPRHPFPSDETCLLATIIGDQRSLLDLSEVSSRGLFDNSVSDVISLVDDDDDDDSTNEFKSPAVEVHEALSEVDHRRTPLKRKFTMIRQSETPNEKKQKRQTDVSKKLRDESNPTWRCSACTFENHGALPYCEMCSSVKSATVRLSPKNERDSVSVKCGTRREASQEENSDRHVEESNVRVNETRHENRNQLKTFTRTRKVHELSESDSEDSGDIAEKDYSGQGASCGSARKSKRSPLSKESNPTDPLSDDSEDEETKDLSFSGHPDSVAIDTGSETVDSDEDMCVLDDRDLQKPDRHTPAKQRRETHSGK